MYELNQKELNILRVLSENSDRPQKQLAALTGLTESDFSRTKKDLFARAIIKKFTIEIDYREIGFRDLGVLFVSVIDKKTIRDTVATITEIPEAIAVFEVFGQAYDLVVKMMCRDNEHLRKISEQITNMDNIRAGVNTFTIVYSRVFKDQPGVPLDAKDIFGEKHP